MGQGTRAVLDGMRQWAQDARRERLFPKPPAQEAKPTEGAEKPNTDPTELEALLQHYAETLK